MSKITHRVKLIQEQLNVCFLDILPLKKGRSAITLHLESYLPQWMSFFLCIDIIIFRGRILWNSMEDGMSQLYLNSTLSFSDFESPLAFPMTSTFLCLICPLICYTLSLLMSLTRKIKLKLFFSYLKSLTRKIKLKLFFSNLKFMDDRRG